MLFPIFFVPLHSLNKSNATMAQLVEQRIRNAWVGGSSPPGGSEKAFREFKQGLSFFCLANYTYSTMDSVKNSSSV